MREEDREMACNFVDRIGRIHYSLWLYVKVQNREKGKYFKMNNISFCFSFFVFYA